MPGGAGGGVPAPPGLLRVLVVFHETHVLGASTSVLRVVDELAAFGWSVSGWVPGEGPLVGEAERRLVSLRRHERPFAFSRRGWRDGGGGLSRARATPAYLRAFREALLSVRPHVVHANTLLTVPEAVVARSCGLPVVLQAHELPEPTAKRSATIRAAASAADVLVAVSGAVASMLQAHAGRTPVVTVRNGVPLAPDTRRSVGGAPFTVGTVGTVSRVKGTDLLLEAAARALSQRADIRFEHVGAADLHRDDGLDAQIGALTAALPRDAVSFRGMLPPSDVLPTWDVFVSTSRSEAFPLATLEAMAAGVPVVATRVGGVPEQIEHGHTGLLVPPDDPQALADAIVTLRDDPALCERLGEAARSHARAEHTIAGQAAGLHRAYITVLTRRFGPPRVRRRARLPA